MSRSKSARVPSAVLLFTIACGFAPAGAHAQDKPTAEAGAQPGAASGDAAKAKVQPVDFRKLKELMPAQAAGLKRARHEGQRVKLGDFSMSTAEATYENPQPESANGDENAETPPSPRVDVTIMDYGATGTAAGLAAGWAEGDIDQESDSGYQKTLKVAGQPAYETWDSEGKNGSLQVYVADRFIVTINTNHLPSEKMQEVARSLQLEKLAAMK